MTAYRGEAAASRSAGLCRSLRTLVNAQCKMLNVAALMFCTFDIWHSHSGCVSSSLRRVENHGTSTRSRRAAPCGGASRARAAGRRRAACAACRPASTRRTSSARLADRRSSRTISASSRMLRSSPVPTLMWPLVLVVLHQEHAGVGQVVDVQELAPRRAGAPDHHLASRPRASRRGTCASAPAARASWSDRSCRSGRRGSSASPR